MTEQDAPAPDERQSKISSFFEPIAHLLGIGAAPMPTPETWPSNSPLGTWGQPCTTRYACVTACVARVTAGSVGAAPEWQPQATAPRRVAFTIR